MKKRALLFFVFLASSLVLYYSCKKDSTEDLTNLISITVTPEDTVIEVGQTVQYKAIGTFADSSTKDITGSVSWNASPEGIVEISGGGLATAITEGKTYVVAGGGTGVIGGSICTNTTAAGLVREQVLAAYQSQYLGSNLANCGWTGNVANCDAGGVSQDSHDKVVQRINYYRRLVGLPGDITLDATKNAKCQKAALIMKANNQLSHFPPNSWTCWTVDGNDAAGNSNIALGMHSVHAVTGYIDDFGASNKAVGHRRWLLYSKAKVMGDGSTDNSNAIWVMGNSSNPLPSSMPEFVAYPPKGYVPGPLVFDRWSFSIPNADFAAATVTMKDGSGQNVTLTIINREEGYGDNTVVWEPDGINTNGPNDVSYTVTVGAVKVGGTDKSFTYTVTVVQPGKSKEADYKTMKAAHPEWEIL
ncbi:MAG: Ig-like domain-containing protein [Bacteroidales bacterium]